MFGSIILNAKAVTLLSKKLLFSSNDVVKSKTEIKQQIYEVTDLQ